MSSFEVEYRKEGDVAVLMPSGYVDVDAKEVLVPRFRTILDQGERKILLNFKDVHKINSMGIAAILELIDQACREEAIIKYSNLSRMNVKLFRMIGLTEYGTIYDSEEDALEAFA